MIATILRTYRKYQVAHFWSYQLCLQSLEFQLTFASNASSMSFTKNILKFYGLQLLAFHFHYYSEVHLMSQEYTMKNWKTSSSTMDHCIHLSFTLLVTLFLFVFSSAALCSVILGKRRINNCENLKWQSTKFNRNWKEFGIQKAKAATVIIWVNILTTALHISIHLFLTTGPFSALKLNKIKLYLTLLLMVESSTKVNSLQSLQKLIKWIHPCKI